MTISGMTGFARRDGAFADWTWQIEVRSVNGRALEARYKGPSAFDTLEKAARDAAQARFARGQININLQARRAEGAGVGLVNLQAIEAYLKISEPFVATGRAAPPRMDGLLALRGVLETGDIGEDAESRAALEAAVTEGLNAALDDLKIARQAEGTALARILGGFVDRIERTVREAETEAAGHPALLRDRFASRLMELAGEAATPERILQEAAAMALKADIREELDRLSNHVAAARSLLAETTAAGRRLDFLTQEFMREANTLCAKAASPALTTLGLDLIASIDQFREQVQNVE